MRFTLRHFINGVGEGYPLCCIIAFCLGKARGIVVRKNLFDVYRSCLLHRKNAISDYSHLKLLNHGVCPVSTNSFDRFGNYK